MKRTLQVLHVEDSERDVALLKRHLSHAGYELISERVDSATAMSEALESREWDVILCDYSMPHFDALSALRLLQLRGLEIPFIIISGTIGEEVAVEAMRAGANDYLMKDRLARLAPTIERELHEAENRRARRRAEERLKDSEAELRALFEAMTDVILVLDEDGRHLKVAPTRSASIYNSGVEPIGKTVHEVFPGEKGNLFHDYVRRALADWGTQRFEYSLSINGEETWFEGTVSPMTPNSVIWVARDITQRIHAEQQLRLQATALQSAANAIVITDRESLISWVNLAFTDLTGYSLEDVSGRSTNLLKSGLHDAAFYRTLWDTILSGKVWHGEITNSRRDGSLYVEEQTITPVMNKAGEITNFVAIKLDITERKKAEEERAQLTAQIENHRQRLNSIITSVPGVVWEAWGGPETASQRIEFVSEFVKTMLGYSVEEWLSTPNFWLSIVHPDDHEEAARVAAASLISGQTGPQEFRWITKDGRALWVESNYVVVTDSAGQPLGLRGVTTDISERKSAEEELIQSERQLAEAQQLAHIGNWNWDLQSKTLSWSDEHFRMFGLKPQELIPTYEVLLERIHLQDREKVVEAVERAIQTQEPLSYHVRVFHPDKGERIIHSRANVTSNEQGQPIRMFGTVQDVTERKRAEEQVRQADEKYRSIFENAVEGIFQSTPDWKFSVVNPSMTRIMGYDSAEDLMAHRTEIGAQHYVDANSRAELELLLAENGVVVGYECEVYRKDRSKIWVGENVRVIRDESGEVRYYEGSIEDITERKTLAAQLRQSQKLEAIGMLAGGIAHDFNNLLTVILGYSDLSLSRLREEDPLHRNISEVTKAAERAAGLTRQLLAFSRKQIMQLKVLDLNVIVSELEKMLRRLIGEDIQLRTVLESDVGSVKADPGQIEQIIMNLAVNARDAMSHGGKLTIETKNVYLDENYANRHIAVLPGPYVMLAVSDSGSGMDQQTQARIFEPFFSTKDAGKGTGLGLSTVYGIVKQSGGNIWVYSEVARGTTFKVYLPRVDEGSQEPERKEETIDALQGSETVLLAEDEEAVRSLARKVLEMHGYQVLEAANGGAALLICERHQETIHLLITDVIMPEMSGRELADRLAQLRPEMKVLYMSGYTDNAIVHHGVLNEGANFIQKPFPTHALVRKVRGVLDAPMKLRKRNSQEVFGESTATTLTASSVINCD